MEEALLAKRMQKEVDLVEDALKTKLSPFATPTLR